MAEFDPAVTYVLENEGVLEENSKDPGGITKYGISLRFLKSLTNPQKYSLFTPTIHEDDIRYLTPEQAKSIYKGEFWDHAPFEQLTNQEIANYVFDMSVNMGISPSIKCLQRALWAVSKLKSILKDDGILGTNTLYYTNMASNAWSCLLAALRSERAGEYRIIVTLHTEQKEFLNGWLERAYQK